MKLFVVIEHEGQITEQTVQINVTKAILAWGQENGLSDIDDEGQVTSVLVHLVKEH